VPGCIWRGVSSVFSMLGTKLFVRVLNWGGSRGTQSILTAPRALTKSFVPSILNTEPEVDDCCTRNRVTAHQSCFDEFEELHSKHTHI
jgi:hypothetical protein